MTYAPPGTLSELLRNTVSPILNLGADITHHYSATHSKAAGRVSSQAALPSSPIRYRFLGRQSLGVEPVNAAVPRLPAGDTQSDQKSIRSAQMRSSGLSVAMWFGEQIN